MSGQLGDYKSKSHWYAPAQIAPAAPERLIHKGNFIFWYDSATRATGYQLPQDNNHQWFRIIAEFSDYRWNSYAIASRTANYFGVGNNIWNVWTTIQVDTSGNISMQNHNGGGQGPFTGKFYVWEITGMSHPFYYNYTV